MLPTSTTTTSASSASPVSRRMRTTRVPRRTALKSVSSSATQSPQDADNNHRHARSGTLFANMTSQSSTSPTAPPLVLPPSSGRSSNKRIANFPGVPHSSCLIHSARKHFFGRIDTSNRWNARNVKTNSNPSSMMTVHLQLDSLPSVSLV